jgi:Methyltransferase domain
MPDAESLRREWEDFSAEWIARAESRADGAREGLLDDWMLDVVGDVADLDVIDLGCGEGRFCRMLAAKGARTLGVDLQPAFIDHAQRNADSAESYRIGDIQPHRRHPTAHPACPMAPSISQSRTSRWSTSPARRRRSARRSGSWCRAGGSWSATCRRWRPPGRPMDRGIGATTARSSTSCSTTTPARARRAVFPSGHELTNFHRMLSTTVNDFLDAGFVLTRVHEPLPTPAQLARVPENDDLFRVPIFIIYDLVKRTS